MIIEIFNVDHGSCALVTTSESHRIMMDCGTRSGTILTSWDPGVELRKRGVTTLDELVVSHADEDHLSGLKSIFDNGVSVRRFTSNPTINSGQIRDLKPEPLGTAVSLYLGCIENQRINEAGLASVIFGPSNIPKYSVEKYHKYCTFSPNNVINTTNNLSVVSFVFSGGLGVVFPGDIEKDGWQVLLRDRDFCSLLRRVNVFVASHHGRDNGFCEEVFRHCSPHLIIFSDGPIIHNTQLMAASYRPFAKGVAFDDGTLRHVLTTRNNGNITFSATDLSYRVTIERK